MNYPAQGHPQKATTPLNNRRVRLSLGIKLPLIALLVLAIAFLVSTILNLRAAQSTLISTLQGELAAQGDSKAELIRSNLIWTRSVAIDLATSAEVIEYDQLTILRVIRNTLKNNQQIFGSTIAYEPYRFSPDLYYWSPYYSRTPTGDIRFTQLGNPEYDYFQWDWYNLPKDKRKPVLSPPYFDAGGGEIWMVTWSAPFFDASGNNVIGVATADIAFSQTQEIINNIQVGETGYAFLLDPNGVILGIGENGGTYQVMVDSMGQLAESSNSKDWESLVKSMTNGETGFKSAVDIQGRSMFVSYTPVGLETRWSLGLAYPQDELFKKSVDLQNALIGYAVVATILASLIFYIFTLSITRPILQLTEYAGKFTFDESVSREELKLQPIEINTRDELEDLTSAFNQMTGELSQSLLTLEDRVNERTSVLNQRATRLKAIADVGKVITSFRNISELLNQTTILIQENFGFYHAGIFLLDDYKEYAVLVAANSEGGLRMLNKKHQLKIGGKSIVGYAIENTQARIALDVGNDAVYFDNPELPDTRSEIALPLVVSGQTLGALDVQSIEAQAFSEEDISTLQILADQIAVAIQNANLFNENEKALENARLVYGNFSREAWSKILRTQSRVGFIATPPGTIQTRGSVLDSSMSRAFETGDIIIDNDDMMVTIPVKIRGQVIGSIRLKKSEISESWTQEEINLAISLSDQLAGALESARLYRETVQRAARESLASDISARISSVSQIDSILRETVNELGQALGNASVTFTLVDTSKGLNSQENPEYGDRGQRGEQ